MIHTIEVDADTDPEFLKKQFRKKLMTGGAVIRLKKGLSLLECERVVKKFLEFAAPHNFATMVIKEVLAMHRLSDEYLQEVEDKKLGIRIQSIQGVVK